MNFLFWNINKKNTSFLFDKISILIQNEHIDVCMLAELDQADTAKLLHIINSRNGNSYKIVQCLVWKKIVIISKKNIYISTYDESGKRIGAFKIKSDIFEKEVLLFPIHFYDKKNYDSTEQNERIEKIKKFIDDTESRHGESNLSIVCGDFNLNPFETPMIKTKGMHAVMEKDIAKKGERIVDGDAYKFFYNPMWGFYGDNGKGNVSGTYFLQRSLNVELFWHLLDQVLIRKGLIDYFEDSQLDIITTIDGNSLLNRNGSINNKDYSDHLPLKFRINI